MELYIVRWIEEDLVDAENYWREHVEAVIVGEENAKRYFTGVQRREFYQEGSAELMKASINEHGVVVPIE